MIVERSHQNLGVRRPLASYSRQGVTFRFGLLALAVTACAPKRAAAISHVAPVCPTLHADSATISKARTGDTAAINRLRQPPEYMSAVIDGSIAQWNQPRSSMSDYVSPFNPPIKPGELKSMRLANASEEKRYGACLGVALIIIETKSGNWRPADSTSRR